MKNIIWKELLKMMDVLQIKTDKAYKILQKIPF